MPATSGTPAPSGTSATPATAEASPAGSAPTSAGPAPTASVAAEAGSVRAPAAGDKLTVVLFARRPVWVSATVDGQKVIGRLLQAGDQETVEVKRELVLTAGDAAAMRMTVNGAEARVLGKTGEIVTARVTPTNFKEYLQTR